MELYPPEIAHHHALHATQVTTPRPLHWGSGAEHFDSTKSAPAKISAARGGAKSAQAALGQLNSPDISIAQTLPSALRGPSDERDGDHGRNSAPVIVFTGVETDGNSAPTVLQPNPSRNRLARSKSQNSVDQSQISASLIGLDVGRVRSRSFGVGAFKSRKSDFQLQLKPTAEDQEEAVRLTSAAEQVIPVLPEYMAHMTSDTVNEELQQNPAYKEGQLRLRLQNEGFGRLYWFVLPGVHNKLLWYAHSLKGVKGEHKELKGVLRLLQVTDMVMNEKDFEICLTCGDDAIVLQATNVDQVRAWNSAIENSRRPPPPPRTGKELWRFLRPRLKMMVALQRQFGDLHMIYSKPSSMFEVMALPCSIRDPESTFSAIWDIMQLFLLVYVSVMVPLRTCFGLEPCVLSLLFFFDMFVDIYFIVDLVLHFRTSHYDKESIDL